MMTLLTLQLQVTGHATVPTGGDYLLSFTANMVSANSQAIWCALYKQSPGAEGWKVLGMINNYLVSNINIFFNYLTIL